MVERAIIVFVNIIVSPAWVVRRTVLVRAYPDRVDTDGKSA
jgi:hypothetical protein